MSIGISIFENKLYESCIRYGVLVHAFILMPSSCEIIVSTPKANLDAFMRHFLTETSKAIGKETKRINHIFGARYKWCWLEQEEHLAYAIKYLYRNPVRQKLTSQIEHYPFSSIYRLTKGVCCIPLSDVWNVTLIPRDCDQKLKWLNQYCPPFYEELVRLALRRRYFHVSKDRKVQLKLPKLKLFYFSKV